MTVFFDFQAFSISILEELKRDERGSKGAKEYAIEQFLAYISKDINSIWAQTQRTMLKLPEILDSVDPRSSKSKNIQKKFIDKTRDLYLDRPFSSEESNNLHAETQKIVEIVFGKSPPKIFKEKKPSLPKSNITKINLQEQNQEYNSPYGYNEGDKERLKGFKDPRYLSQKIQKNPQNQKNANFQQQQRFEEIKPNLPPSQIKGDRRESRPLQDIGRVRENTPRRSSYTPNSKYRKREKRDNFNFPENENPLKKIREKIKRHLKENSPYKSPRGRRYNTPEISQHPSLFSSINSPEKNYPKNQEELEDSILTSLKHSITPKKPKNELFNSFKPVSNLKYSNQSPQIVVKEPRDTPYKKSDLLKTPKRHLNSTLSENQRSVTEGMQLFGFLYPGDREPIPLVSDSDLEFLGFQTQFEDFQLNDNELCSLSVDSRSKNILIAGSQLNKFTYVQDKQSYEKTLLNRISLKLNKFTFSKVIICENGFFYGQDSMHNQVLLFDRNLQQIKTMRAEKISHFSSKKNSQKIKNLKNQKKDSGDYFPVNEHTMLWTTSNYDISLINLHDCTLVKEVEGFWLDFEGKNFNSGILAFGDTLGDWIIGVGLDGLGRLYFHILLDKKLTCLPASSVIPDFDFWKNGIISKKQDEFLVIGSKTTKNGIETSTIAYLKVSHPFVVKAAIKIPGNFQVKKIVRIYNSTTFLISKQQSILMVKYTPETSSLNIIREIEVIREGEIQDIDFSDFKIFAISTNPSALTIVSFGVKSKFEYESSKEEEYIPPTVFTPEHYTVVKSEQYIRAKDFENNFSQENQNENNHEIQIPNRNQYNPPFTPSKKLFKQYPSFGGGRNNNTGGNNNFMESEDESNKSNFQQQNFNFGGKQKEEEAIKNGIKSSSRMSLQQQQSVIRVNGDRDILLEGSNLMTEENNERKIQAFNDSYNNSRGYLSESEEQKERFTNTDLNNDYDNNHDDDDDDAFFDKINEEINQKWSDMKNEKLKISENFQNSQNSFQNEQSRLYNTKVNQQYQQPQIEQQNYKQKQQELENEIQRKKNFVEKFKILPTINKSTVNTTNEQKRHSISQFTPPSEQVIILQRKAQRRLTQKFENSNIKISEIQTPSDLGTLLKYIFLPSRQPTVHYIAFK